MNRALQGIRHHFLQAGLLDYLEHPYDSDEYEDPDDFDEE